MFLFLFSSYRLTDSILCVAMRFSFFETYRMIFLSVSLSFWSSFSFHFFLLMIILFSNREGLTSWVRECFYARWSPSNVLYNIHWCIRNMNVTDELCEKKKFGRFMTEKKRCSFSTTFIYFRMKWSACFFSSLKKRKIYLLEILWEFSIANSRLIKKLCSMKKSFVIACVQLRQETQERTKTFESSAILINIFASEPNSSRYLSIKQNRWVEKIKILFDLFEDSPSFLYCFSKLF